ncbi:MAG: hypothetical protein HZA50_17490 [Planctomycetes bacterium]|nr:hypothetical protein [Planctomycetota bacterium]
MDNKLRFTEQDWQRMDRDWSAFWAGELDRPLVLMDHRILPPERQKLLPAPGFVPQLPMDMPADEVIDRYQAQLEALEYYGDSFPKWWVNFGPGILAGFIGAEVHVTPETVWFEPAERKEIQDIHPRFDPNNRWWKRIVDLTRTACQRWAGRICVCYTDIGGNLDVLASLRTTEQLLADLYDYPQEVDRLVKEITAVWMKCYDELDAIIRPIGKVGASPWASIWSPKRCYMLQSDFCYMISPQMFERFVLPDLTECCDRMDHGFYHLDGKGQLPHLDMILSIKSLRGVQWIPGAGLPEAGDWPDVLGRIRKAGKLCQVYVNPEGALKIVRELGGKGFILHIHGGLVDRKEAKEILDAIMKANRGR